MIFKEFLTPTHIQGHTEFMILGINAFDSILLYAEQIVFQNATMKEAFDNK